MLDAMKALLPDTLDPYAPMFVGALTALVILTIGWIISKWVHRMIVKFCVKRNLDEALGRFLASITQYAILAAAVIAALGRVGVESTSLVAILGAAGLAVGFALQGSLANFAAGVMMLLFRPIDIGQRVTVAGHTGAVEEIGLFATTLTTPDSETIIIPNSKITDDSIVNYARLGKVRANVSIGVAYGTDIAKAMQVIQKACAGSDLVLADPAPDVAFAGFGASSLDLLARPWSLPDDFPSMQHHVRIAIYDALAEAGIEIPFDQIVLHQA
ncbi:MAG: mechanosensitive ion channel [Acidobacteriota bacterium]|nr:mechanosensitive ion channel [Acidobacteriota bacterium]